MLQVPDWTKDNAAGRKILQHHGLEVFEAPIHLEGGSIHTDGEGSVLSSAFVFACFVCLYSCLSSQPYALNMGQFCLQLAVALRV